MIMVALIHLLIFQVREFAELPEWVAKLEDGYLEVHLTLVLRGGVRKVPVNKLPAVLMIDLRYPVLLFRTYRESFFPSVREK